MSKYRKVKVKKVKERDLFIVCGDSIVKDQNRYSLGIFLRVYVHDKDGKGVETIYDSEQEKIAQCVQDLINGKIR